ncbi:MAG: AAA family ATPase [Gordonibacter sp.]|nr:AAA family ATPase [Gordonibacter sp.]
MKKRNVLNLIKYYSEHNDVGFRNEAYDIARAFDNEGDYQLSEYIMALLSDANTFVPQMSHDDAGFLRRIGFSKEALPLPEAIMKDVKGAINAIGHNAGINKYLFQGPPGTGKTETAKQIANILNRDFFSVDSSSVIDSRLGQTAKNIMALFREINGFAHPERVVVLFDEIDTLALDRTNSNDVREMGRATSAVLKSLDELNENVVLIATTNLYPSFDKALVRRFDSIIDFGRYSQEDLLDISEIIMNGILSTFKFAGRDMRVFHKIMELMPAIPYPGELKNMLRTTVAFSDPGDEYDYLKSLYRSVALDNADNIRWMKDRGFTVREMEKLTGRSKSSIARELKEQNYE